MLKAVTLWDFADDLVLAGESEEKLQRLVDISTEELESRGLKINAAKTKRPW